MYFERIVSEGLAHYSYIFGDAGEAIVIDPRRDCEVYVEKAQERGLRITHVLETHRHEDFLVGSAVLAGMTGARLWHADSQWEYRYGEAAREGQAWRLGTHSLEALATPGHTPGSLSYLLRFGGGEPWMIFTGDALFAGEAGRVDLMGPEKMRQMAALLHESIFSKILPLGDGVMLMPAHGSGSACGSSIASREWTTIGIERRLNPRLKKPDREAFMAEMAMALERPPYFRRMEELNLLGPGAMPQLPPPVTAGEFAARMESGEGEALLLDTRDELEYNAAHVPGSAFIWEEGLSSYAGWFLDYDRPLLLITGKGGPSSAARQLVRLGFDDIRGWLAGGLLGWHNAGFESKPVSTMMPQQLCDLLERKEELCILDVRGEEELKADGKIPGSTNIHITLLPERLNEVPGCERLFIFCGTGKRSTIAASLLERSGRRPPPTVILGGIAGWKMEACPLQK